MMRRPRPGQLGPWSAAIGVALLVCCLRGESGRSQGESCGEAGQCAEGLVCSFGRCRPRCTFDRDCSEGGACVASEGTGARVCTFDDEGSEGSAPCPGGLSLDEQGACRERCGEPTACGEDRLCVDGLCYDDATADGDADRDADGDADTDGETDEDADEEAEADAEADADADDGDTSPSVSDFGVSCVTDYDCESGVCFDATLDYPFLCYGRGCSAFCESNADCVRLATEADVPSPEGALCSSRRYCDLVNTGLPQFVCE